MTSSIIHSTRRAARRIRARVSYANVAATFALVLAARGFAVASIPSVDGTIHGCVAPDGLLRVIDKEAGASCAAGQTPISWTQAPRLEKVKAEELERRLASVSTAAGDLRVSMDRYKREAKSDLELLRRRGIKRGLLRSTITLHDLLSASRPLSTIIRPAGRDQTSSLREEADRVREAERMREEMEEIILLLEQSEKVVDVVVQMLAANQAIRSNLLSIAHAR